MKVLAIVLLSFAAVGYVQSHGVLLQPLARHAYFRNPSFPQNVPMYWDSQGVSCDGDQTPTTPTCGRCGFGSNDNSMNLGGTYGHSHVAANYSAGSIVEIRAEFQATHYGYMEVELCNSQTESNGCFSKLVVVSASEQVRVDNRVCTPYGNDQTRTVTARVQLPSGLRCSRCTMRWTYRTSYPGWQPYEQCYNPNPAQTFRNCANVAIN